MFKKTLLATALSAAAMSATAATVAVTGETVSVEGVANEVSIAQPTTVITLGAEYTINDIITLTVNNAEILSGATPVLTYADASGGDGSGTMTLGLLSTTATTATFRVTELTANSGDGLTAGDTLTLTGLTFDGPSVAALADAVEVELTYTANATGSNLPLDTGGTNTDTVFTMTGQFSSSVTTALNETVDVNADRQQFVAAATTDTLVITPAEAAVDTADAAYDGAVHVITGDFSFMDTDIDGEVSVAELNAAVDCTGTNADTCADGTHALNATMDELTITALDGGGNVAGAHSIVFNVAGQGAGNPIVDDGAFSVVTSVNYTPATGAADMVEFASATAGAWDLNGANFTVPYLPYGTNTQVIFRVTNTGNQTGALSINYVRENDATSTWTTINNVMDIEPGVTDIGPALIDAIIADSGSSADKVSVEVTINTPDTDISAFVGFKVKKADSTGDGSRTTVGTFGQLGDLKFADK